MRISAAFVVATFGASVSAAPPKQFALSISARLSKDPTVAPTTLYLGKDGQGTGVKDIKDAISCTIDSNTQLVCGGKVYGAQSSIPLLSNQFDMAPFAPVTASFKISDGFSIDDKNVLHWKSDNFKKLDTYNAINKQPGGEAQFGLFQSALLTGGKLRLYSQLGCPGGDHGGVHDMLWVGTNKVVPL